MNTLDLLWSVRDLADERVGARHKAVLCGLVAHRKTSGVIAPALAQLMAATGLSRATVIRAIDELAAWGYVTKFARGQHYSSIYTLRLPPAKQTSQPETSRGETSAPETSHDETPHQARGLIAGARGLMVSPSEDLSEDPRSRSPLTPQGGEGAGDTDRRPADPPPSPPPTTDGRLPPSEARFAREFWIEAYRAGVATVAGEGWTFPPRSFGALERVVAARVPRDQRGQIDRWIRRGAEAFARAVQAKPAVWSGYSADGFERWLNAGQPTEGEPARREDPGAGSIDSGQSPWLIRPPGARRRPVADDPDHRPRPVRSATPPRTPTPRREPSAIGDVLVGVPR